MHFFNSTTRQAPGPARSGVHGCEHDSVQRRKFQEDGARLGNWGVLFQSPEISNLEDSGPLTGSPPVQPLLFFVSIMHWPCSCGMVPFSEHDHDKPVLCINTSHSVTRTEYTSVRPRLPDPDAATHLGARALVPFCILRQRVKSIDNQSIIQDWDVQTPKDLSGSPKEHFIAPQTTALKLVRICFRMDIQNPHCTRG